MAKEVITEDDRDVVEAQGATGVEVPCEEQAVGRYITSLHFSESFIFTVKILLPQKTQQGCLFAIVGVLSRLVRLRMGLSV